MFLCPPVVPGKPGCAKHASIGTYHRAPARDMVFSDVEEKAAELYEVWCLVSEAG